MNQEDMDALRERIAAALRADGFEAKPGDEGDSVYASDADVDFALTIELA